MTRPSTSFPDQARFRATNRQVSSDLGGEVVILDLEGSRYYGLDGVGARVWELLSESRSVAELQQALLAEYDVDEEQCRRDLELLLAGLETRGLVVRDGDAA